MPSISHPPLSTEQTLMENWTVRRARILSRVARVVGVASAALYVWVLLGLATPARALFLAALLPARALALRYHKFGPRGQMAFQWDAWTLAQNKMVVYLYVPGQTSPLWFPFIWNIL